MTQEKNFVVKTKMEPEDYRRFLYTATFRRSPMVFPVIALVALVGAILQSWMSGNLSIFAIIIYWALLFLVAMGVICFQVEHRNKHKIKTDETGFFGSEISLTFYETYVTMETPVVAGTSTVRYDQFYQVLESKQYFILYHNKNMASLIRKQDVEDVEALQKFLKEKIRKKYRCIF